MVAHHLSPTSRQGKRVRKDSESLNAGESRKVNDRGGNKQEKERRHVGGEEKDGQTG